jgi:hypothetical protein
VLTVCYHLASYPLSLRLRTRHIVDKAIKNGSKIFCGSGKWQGSIIKTGLKFAFLLVNEYLILIFY